jgi:hypothetical protein
MSDGDVVLWCSETSLTVNKHYNKSSNVCNNLARNMNTYIERLNLLLSHSVHTGCFQKENTSTFSAAACNIGDISLQLSTIYELFRFG